MMNHDHRPDLGAGAGWRAATQGSRRLEEYEYDEEYDESYAYEMEKNNVDISGDVDDAAPGFVPLAASSPPPPPPPTPAGEMHPADDDNCFGADKPLMEPFIWKPFMDKMKPGLDGFGFCIPIWPIPLVELCGSITANVALSVSIGGAVCMDKKIELNVYVAPRATLILMASIYVRVMGLAQAGIQGVGEVVSFEPRPTGFLRLSNGLTAGMEFWLCRPAATLTLSAFVDLIAIKFCNHRQRQGRRDAAHGRRGEPAPDAPRSRRSQLRRLH